jgi:hypothetical protein
MVRESRSNWVLRSMRESRDTFPSEKLFLDIDEAKTLSQENKILYHNVKELQKQLQNAYIRIKELTTDTKQMELF